ncbi:conserved protein of unknown function [Methylorubrum extorquens]|uniref:Uncharacterized protein n=1 Tax=Methylorubrum extorquens TaxID=408 RepID=A0A2N9ARM7_METEX|nr:conserved protein of unknown function [Methylorubrum extorquens]
MSGRRKSKPVTLAGRAALKQVPIHTLSENAPTPERLMQAGVTVAMQLGTRQTQIIGKASPFGIDGVMRLASAPLDRLHSRGRLDDDGERNSQLHEAGDKLRNHYYLGGLSGFAANDLNSTGGGHPSSRVPISETMESNRRALRLAKAAMHPGDWQVVSDVVCLEKDLKNAGYHAGCTNDDAATAVALDRLRRGLDALAHLWGFSPPQHPTHKSSAKPPICTAA